MNSVPQFLVNFLRDRDSYHVPSALYARGMLSSLITDIYYDTTPLLLRTALPRKLREHRSSRMAGARVRNCYLSAALQAMRSGPLRGIDWFTVEADRALARLTRDIWLSYPTELLLYSGYALEAFRAATGSNSKRLMFLFHPHYQLVDSILAADAEQFPEAAAGYAAAPELSERRKDIADEELALCDGVIAASAFSVSSISLIRPEIPTAVVPYFSETAKNINANGTRGNNIVRFLFVGQGVQRKGLHHLMRAWKAAALPDAQLLCVCASLDESLVPQGMANVTFVRGLPRSELFREYDRAHCFVMPSLVEGFGLVYLEAMARGAYVIGSENTGLPDIHVGQNLASQVSPGRPDLLADELRAVYLRLRKREIDHQAIADSIEGYGFDAYADRLCYAARTMVQHRAPT